MQTPQISRRIVLRRRDKSRVVYYFDGALRPIITPLGDQLYRGRLLAMYPDRYERMHYPALNYHPVTERLKSISK